MGKNIATFSRKFFGNGSIQWLYCFFAWLCNVLVIPTCRNVLLIILLWLFVRNECWYFFRKQFGMGLSHEMLMRILKFPSLVAYWNFLLHSIFPSWNFQRRKSVDNIHLHTFSQWRRADRRIWLNYIERCPNVERFRAPIWELQWIMKVSPSTCWKLLHSLWKNSYKFTRTMRPIGCFLCRQRKDYARRYRKQTHASTYAAFINSRHISLNMASVILYSAHNFIFVSACRMSMLCFVSAISIEILRIFILCMWSRHTACHRQSCVTRNQKKMNDKMFKISNEIETEAAHVMHSAYGLLN